MRPTPAPGPWAEDIFTYGVTGTNGKTSSVFMIAAVLAAAGHRALKITTVGDSFDGRAIPRGKGYAAFLESLRECHAQGCRHAAIEATSRGLSLGYAAHWRFDLGVFTNLSPDHLRTHGSWEHYLAAKAQLFALLGPGRIAVLNAADQHAMMIDLVTPADVRRLWFASPTRGPLLRPADLEAAAIEVSPAGTQITLRPSQLTDALGPVLTTPLIGEVFAENALAAAAATLGSGIAPQAVARGLATTPPVPGRFELVARHPFVVIDYAHTPDAIERTCRTARLLAGAGGEVRVVFGAGGDSTPEKRRPMGQAVGRLADSAYVTTDNPRHEDPAAIAGMLIEGVEHSGRARLHVIPDRREAIARALQDASAADVVVVAGKGHETGQRVGGEVLPFSDSEVVRELVGDGGAR